MTLWIHPFVNLECPTWNEVAIGNKGYFVRDPKVIRLNQHLPGLVYWWQGDLASYVDFTNPEAVTWWRVSQQFTLAKSLYASGKIWGFCQYFAGFLTVC